MHHTHLYATLPFVGQSIVCNAIICVQHNYLYAAQSLAFVCVQHNDATIFCLQRNHLCSTHMITLHKKCVQRSHLCALCSTIICVQRNHLFQVAAQSFVCSAIICVQHNHLYAEESYVCSAIVYIRYSGQFEGTLTANRKFSQLFPPA